MSALAVVREATTLPDPGDPSIIPLTGVIGGFAVGTVAQLCGLPNERVAQLTLLGTRCGVGVGIGCYLVAVAIDRL